MNLKFAYLFAFLLMSALPAQSQNMISGIVVDSISLAGLPDVHIRIKNIKRSTESNKNGSFIIMAADYDTLVFSAVGYHNLEYPLMGPESDVIIRISPSIKMLKEVTINANPPEEIMVKKPPRYTTSDGSTYTRSPTPTLADGISAPFTYFSKIEREKRKLVKLREENRRIKTYVALINDPVLKSELLKKFSLTEKEYYDLLAKFNQEHQAIYLSNTEEIKKQLYFFIKNSATKK
jgi:hypothetical protein